MKEKKTKLADAKLEKWILEPFNVVMLLNTTGLQQQSCLFIWVIAPSCDTKQKKHCQSSKREIWHGIHISITTVTSTGHSLKMRGDITSVCGLLFGIPVNMPTSGLFCFVFIWHKTAVILLQFLEIHFQFSKGYNQYCWGKMSQPKTAVYLKKVQLSFSLYRWQHTCFVIMAVNGKSAYFLTTDKMPS